MFVEQTLLPKEAAHEKLFLCQTLYLKETEHVPTKSETVFL